MDDPLEDFTELEAELKALRPKPSSADLQARLAAELADAPRVWPWWAWSALPVAAAITLGIFIAQPRSTPTAPTTAAQTATIAATFRPVATENVLYAAKDEGYVTLEDGTPARRLRSSYVDTITWKDPRSNASLRWTVPREDVRVVPVNFQ